MSLWAFRRAHLLPALFFCFFVPGFISVVSAQEGGTLRVMPVRIDVQAPVVSGVLTMSNSGRRPMIVQVRVFKWLQQDGKNLYVPAREVAVSPPMITLRPKAESVLRVVRTSREPLTREESYRVVIDQLPVSTLQRATGSGLSFVVRHNIPAFFSPRGDFAPQIKWRITPIKGGYQVTAINSGARHARFSQIKLLARGKVVAQENGLAGYALAGTSGSFFVPGRTGGKPDRIQAIGMNNQVIDDIIN